MCELCEEDLVLLAKASDGTLIMVCERCSRIKVLEEKDE